jgi:hypothetical protein
VVQVVLELMELQTQAEVVAVVATQGVHLLAATAAQELLFLNIQTFTQLHLAVE